MLADYLLHPLFVDDDGQAMHSAIQDDSSNSDSEDSPLDVLLETMEAMDGKYRVTQLHITVVAVCIFKGANNKDESSDNQQIDTRSALGDLNSEGS